MTIEMARSIIDAKLAELEYEYKDSALDFNLPYIKALKTALKALEQYDVLEKIRAEIDQKAYPIVHGVNNHEMGMTLYGIHQIFDIYNLINIKENNMNNKNMLPALPIEVAEFENAAVKLIKDGICTQGDLHNLMIFSQKISDAETERLKKLEKWVPYKSQKENTYE